MDDGGSHRYMGWEIGLDFVLLSLAGRFGGAFILAKFRSSACLGRGRELCSESVFACNGGRA